MKRYFAIFGIMLLFAFGISATAQEAQKKTLKPSQVERVQEVPKAQEEASKKTLSPQAVQEAQNVPQPKAKAVQPAGLQGTVVSLNNLVFDRSGKVTKEEAMALVDAKQPLLFKAVVDGATTLFIVCNDKGFPETKKLADVAHFDQVTIQGEVKTISGLNFLIAKKITGK